MNNANQMRKYHAEMAKEGRIAIEKWVGELECYNQITDSEFTELQYLLDKFLCCKRDGGF